MVIIISDIIIIIIISDYIVITIYFYNMVKILSHCWHLFLYPFAAMVP